MNTQPNTDASARVRMRTDGPPVPVFRDKHPLHHQESFMSMSKRRLGWLIPLAVGAVMFGGLVGHAFAATAEDLDKDASQALTTLYGRNPTAEVIAKKAKAILVFPKVIKAGLVFGGAYGEGVLMKAGQPTAYYNSVSASWGFQAGAESYAYVVFLMSDKAVNYLATSKGWELGVGPTLVVVNEGVAKNLSTSTLKDDAYAFITDQQGLMASVSIEGTKISHIKR
jgi:lipid-binding SYLF domain-containing protein